MLDPMKAIEAMDAEETRVRELQQRVAGLQARVAELESDKAALIACTLAEYQREVKTRVKCTAERCWCGAVEDDDGKLSDKKCEVCKGEGYIRSRTIDDRPHCTTEQNTGCQPQVICPGRGKQSVSQCRSDPPH